MCSKAAFRALDYLVQCKTHCYTSYNCNSPGLNLEVSFELPELLAAKMVFPRCSFRKSLDNAIIQQTVWISEKELNDNFITDEFVKRVVKHMENKARYKPAWADYIIDIPDKDFKIFMIGLLEDMRTRKVTERMVTKYVHYVKDLQHEQEGFDWLPVPTDFLLFNKRYQQLEQEHVELRKKREKKYSRMRGY